MANLNKVFLIGNLTRDVELKYLPSNMAIANFGLALNRKYTTAAGEKREEVCFVDCAAFGKTAEVLNQYVLKGDPIMVEGRLKLDQWESKDGGKRSKLSVVIENFQFLKSKSGGNSEPQAGGAPESSEDQPF